MARIKIEDLPKDLKINRDEMKKIIGGTANSLEVLDENIDYFDMMQLFHEQGKASRRQARENGLHNQRIIQEELMRRASEILQNSFRKFL